MPPLAPILLVDDEKNTREGLRLALEDSFEVYTAADLAGAQAILQSVPIQVLVTDLRLGGESGMDLVEAARRLPLAPVTIMMTAYGDVATAVEAMRRGAWHFLTKPLDLEELEALVRRAAVLFARQQQAAAPPTATAAAQPPEHSPASPGSRQPFSKKPTRRRAQSTTASPTTSRSLPAAEAALARLLGDSPSVVALRELIEQVAPSRASVLIQGESGTGKELVAQAIHALSPRATGPFVPVHCAALSEQLLESELFGHEAGAFTGASQQRIGRFELAHGGTLFLDEIGEISPTLQVKLLRALGERVIERVGGAEPIPVDVRLVSATNRDLWQMVLDGQFRDDLYYRLAVVRIEPPPLRQRGADIRLLAEQFLEEFSRENDLAPKKLTPETLDRLLNHRWPGNIRELRTVIEHAVVLSRQSEITPEALPSSMAVRALDPPALAQPPRLSDEPNAATTASPHALRGETATTATTAADQRFNLQRHEAQLIEEALAATSGNRTQAARLLGISRRTLQRKLGDEAAE